jgi:hypothetical protein
MAARGKEKNMIACGARSYRVGDLMLGLPSSWKAGELILIVRESGHPRYFYGLDCSTGEEHLFNLEYFCGYDET